MDKKDIQNIIDRDLVFVQELNRLIRMKIGQIKENVITLNKLIKEDNYGNNREHDRGSTS